MHGTLIYPDRGVQYRVNEYQEALEMHGLRCIMIRKGNCWENAVMESFYSLMKVKLIYAEHCQTVEEVRLGIFQYIEIIDNAPVGIQRLVMSVCMTTSSSLLQSTVATIRVYDQATIGFSIK